MTGTQGAFAHSPSLFSFAFDRQSVRVVLLNGNPWFVGKDVAGVLGYADSTNAMKQHCKGVVKRHPLQTGGGIQSLRILPESDMLRLVINSKLPAAEKFERWVFEEVLPSIRKTGRYETRAAAPDYLSSGQMAEISRVVGILSRWFYHDMAASRAMWSALRNAADCPSPHKFETRHARALADECRRLLSIVTHGHNAILDAERALIRRVLKNGEDIDAVLMDMQARLDEGLDEANVAMTPLGRWLDEGVRRIAGEIA